MKIIVLLALICASAVTVQGRRGRRVKRWAYPPLYVEENEPGETFVAKRITQAIKSEKLDVKQYVLKGTPVDDGMFEIKTDSEQIGWIWQKKPVDREVQEKYTMELLALDGYGVQVEEPIKLVVNVWDKNDETPAFVTKSLIANVQEDAAGVVFHRIEAVDKDSSTDYNNVIKFTKIAGSEDPPGDRFKVADNGNIEVTGGLDAENIPRITFQVQAEDRNGVDGNKATATVSVDILDANDHAPVFVGEPYEVDIKETVALGFKAFSIQATDEDVGINSQVSFKITSGNDEGHFKMLSYPGDGGTSVGQLTVVEELDFETPPTSYSLTVVGYNANATNADDVNFQTQTTIKVNVVDENEPPKFQGTPYTATVIENTITKTQNLKVKIKAIDYDFGGQEVTYSLQEDEKWFEISPDGTLKTIDFIDREDPRVDQGTSVYKLVVVATDPDGKFENAIVSITVQDENDNAPEPYGGGWESSICNRLAENETVTHVTDITAMDRDSKENGPPFTFDLLPNSKYEIQPIDAVSARVTTTESYIDIGVYEEVVIIKDSPTKTIQTATATLTINVCSCDEDGTPMCSAAGAVYVNSASTPLIIGIILAILLLVVLVLVAMSYSRRKSTDVQKRDLLLDDDDVRDTLRDYHDEGGGEEDNDVYDMGALQPLALQPGVPYRMDEKPLFAEPQPRMALPPDTKVEEYLQDAKKQADGDPTAPPFDSLLVFDYEGQGSDAGSLSSINSGTTEGSQDYDYLKDWGPRFNKIADAYGGHESN